MAADKINQRGEQKASEGMDKGLDAMEGKNTDQNKTEGEEAKQESDQVEGDDAEETKAAPQQEQTPLQSYSKYDFIPGQKVIFYEDFSQDNVGDFPALWNTNGSGEVVTTNLFPGKWLQVSGDYSVWTNDLLALPDNYTIEFDIIPMENEEGNMAGYYFRMLQSVNANAFDWGAVPGKAGFCYHVEYFGRPSYSTYMSQEGGAALALSGYLDGDKYKQELHKKYHIAIWVQKSRVRLYQGEIKAVDLPKAFPLPEVKMDRIRFEEGNLLVSNIRIAVGAPDTRNKLLTEGKLVTYGIYFDVNKDVVKPESYGTLKDIAAVLTENPDVRVKIVGHTDADGADAANLDLSKRRAASVKNELVKSFAIDGSRIETDGMGESQPIAPNDTPANKALNRRVEFLKL
jgi:outer membrane protein OmpA-like peptidoglycan-associated protein